LAPFDDWHFSNYWAWTGQFAPGFSRFTMAFQSGAHAVAKSVSFAFFRKNCKTCEKALAYLEFIGVQLPSSTEDARKVRKSQEEMVELARRHKRVVSVKGSKLVECDIKKENPTPAAILGLLSGPSGNLRAPTLSVSGTLVIGFSPETYNQLLS
jgi:arsenate reductase-like glutaredoxin family protein